MPPAQAALGIDIGGTHVRTGLVSAAGAVVARAASPLPRGGDPVQLSALLAQHVQQVLPGKECTVSAVGVAVPGIWDRQTGLMQQALNLPHLEGVNLRQLFARAFGRPVLVESDVNAAGWAQWHATEPRPERFVYLSIGTGVGGSVILGGQIVRHSRGGAGHFGHLIVDTSPDAPPCRCGARGCLEALVSGPALLPGDTQGPDRACRALAIALVQLAVIYAPDVISLGGGVIDHRPELPASVAAVFQRARSSLVPAGIQVQRASLSSDEAGIRGAALLALHALSGDTAGTKDETQDGEMG